MAVSRESGSEDKTTRKLRNINQTRTSNTNYYQVLQQYDVQLSLEEISLVLLGYAWNPVPSDVLLPNHPETRLIVDSLKRYSLDPKDPDKFQNTLMRYVTPLPDISTEPDPLGNLRFAYLLNQKREKDVLEYLFSLVTSSRLLRTRTVATDESLYDTIGLYPSHFLFAVEEERLTDAVDDAIQSILSNLQDARNGIGPVGDKWSAAIPTHGVYAEAVLGACSASEDYIEINRQFDLELKRLDIQRLQLELERRRIENEQLGQTEGSKVLIKNGSEKTAVNVILDIDSRSKSGATTVEIAKETSG